MAYVPIPKDLTKVKTKVMFNLTKRQLICFGAGILVGAPLFFLLLRPLGSSTAAMCMMLVMLPFFLLGVYEKNGQPLEKMAGNIIRASILRPRQRPYRSILDQADSIVYVSRTYHKNCMLDRNRFLSTTPPRCLPFTTEYGAVAPAQQLTMPGRLAGRSS